MEVPTGWVQVLRGPRPPSQKWPMAQPVQRPRQPRVSPVPAGPRAPTVRVSPDGNREAARLKVVKIQQALAVMGDTDLSGCRVSEGGVGEGKKGLPEAPTRCRGRRVPEVHHQVREARERESEQSALTNAKARLQRWETEQSVPVEEAPAPADWKAKMEALQAQVNSLREERDQAVHSPALKRQAVGHVPSRVSGVIPPMPTLVPCRVRQLDARSSVGAPECDELGDQRRVVEVSTKLAEGASQMVYMTGGMAT